MESRKVEALAGALRAQLGDPPDWVVVAGSGLSRVAESIADATVVPYAALPGMPGPTVAGHAGRVVGGRIGRSRVAIFCGRCHGYESGRLEACVRAVRAAAAWGCKRLILTNASGALNPAYAPGDLMLIADQIHLMFRSPLRGAEGTAFGPRFVDLSDAYDPGLRQQAREAAREAGVRLHEGVYVANLGPAFETPAEGRMLRRLGGDAVGMSTAPETIAARQAGLRVLGLSYVANSLVHKPAGKTTHEEVLANASLALATLAALLERICGK